MVAYTFYEGDGRVRRYAETLVRRGDEVDVIALRWKEQSRYEIISGVNVYKIQSRVSREKGKLSYLSRLARFFLRSTIFLSKQHLKHRYDVIHVHSVPDFEVFAAVFAKISGAKLILDIHDLVPEFYVSKFNTSKDSLMFKLLALAEKASIAFSDHVIIANHLWQETLVSRSVKKEKCTTILNYPDPHMFTGQSRTRKDNKIIMMYPGSVNWHQGIDIAVRAFALIKDHVPEAEFHIYTTEQGRALIEGLVSDLNLQGRVIMNSALPIDEIAKVMANADLGVVPKRADSFGNTAFSTKILEFMALGVPVIVSKTAIDQYYFDDSLVMFFESGNERELADCMLKIIKNKEIRERLKASASRYINLNNWGIKNKEYLQLVDTLTGSTEGGALEVVNK